MILLYIANPILHKKIAIEISKVTQLQFFINRQVDKRDQNH